MPLKLPILFWHHLLYFFTYFNHIHLLANFMYTKSMYVLTSFSVWTVTHPSSGVDLS
jgi:hypothetical protein